MPKSVNSINNGQREQSAVHPVENASVSQEKIATVLQPGPSLHRRFGKISELTRNVPSEGQHAYQRQGKAWHAVYENGGQSGHNPIQVDGSEQAGSGGRGDCSLPAFARADTR